MRSSERNLDIREKALAKSLALVTAIAAALDSITTYIAVRSGALELNPLIALFIQDPVLYIYFSTAKSWIIYILFSKMNVNSFWEIVIWAAITYLFLRASLINILNYIHMVI